MAALPEEASLAVARIEAMLDEADRLIERTGAADESAFSLKETGRRYLPDTLNAYLNVPASQRDTVADTLLVDQLRLLERATAARLAALAAAGRSDLAANGAFLAERFGPAQALPEVPQGTQPPALAPPRALVARLFADLQGPRRAPFRGRLSNPHHDPARHLRRRPAQERRARGAARRRRAALRARGRTQRRGGVVHQGRARGGLTHRAHRSRRMDARAARRYERVRRTRPRRARTSYCFSLGVTVGHEFFWYRQSPRPAVHGRDDAGR